MNQDLFARIFEVESRKKELKLYQQNVGDVSCVVWDAALVLANYLDTLCNNDRLGCNWLVGKKVLELGSGVGCVGMTAACLGFVSIKKKKKISDKFIFNQIFL